MAKAKPFLMKGKVFKDHKHKLVYPVMGEVKYDDIRLHVHCDLLTRKVSFLSYDGKPLYNLHPWVSHFADFMQSRGLSDLDIGVEVNENFGDSYRWCRSSSGFPQEKLDKKTGKVAPALFPEMVAFYLFDVPDWVGIPYRNRVVMLDKLVEQMEAIGLNAYRPARQLCANEAALDALFIEVRELGLEGLMVKTEDHTYEPGKRIDGWLKMKPSDPADGKIVKINQAFSIDGVPLARAGSIDVVMEDGSTASPSGIAHELGALMWAHPEDYVGEWLEFQYMERDRQGGYRHPSFTRLRESK